MGVRASLTIVPAEAFAAIQADPDAPTPDRGEPFELGKTWFNFHLIFCEEPGPLRYAIEGDLPERPLARNLILEDDQDEEDEGGVHFAYVRPETVQAIAAALENFPRWKMMDRLRKANPWWVRHKDGRDRFSAAYDELVRAYTTAAAQGTALRVLIC